MKHTKLNLTTVIAIAVAVVFFAFAASFVLKIYIERQIKHIEFDGFTIQTKSVHVNMLQRQVAINNIKIKDSAKLATLNIDRLDIKHIHVFALLFNGNFGAGKVSIQSPNLLVDTAFFKSSIFNKTASSSDNNKKLNIETLEILEANILFVSSDSLNQDTLFNTRLNLSFDKLIKNGEPYTYNYKGSSFDRLQFSLLDGIYNFSESLYSFRYDSLSYDSDKKNLNIDTLKLKSRYPAYKIGPKTGYETDWFDFTFAKLSFDKIRLHSLLSNSALILSEGRIGSFEGRAFKDKRLPFPDKPDTKLPMAMLNRLPVGIHCDSFFIDKARIEYAERVDDSDKAGMVYFEELSARIDHLSTIDSLITKPTTMQAQARVMGEALLEATFTFPNKKYPTPYRAYGKMGSMSVKPFNTIVKQNAFVKAETGHIKDLSFDFSYTNDTSGGKLIFEYEDLKITVLNKEDFSKKDITSFIVNSFVLHKDNSRDGNKFREGTISFERDKKRSIFNYWWKSVLSGLKTIAIF